MGISSNGNIDPPKHPMCEIMKKYNTNSHKMIASWIYDQENTNVPHKYFHQDPLDTERSLRIPS
tara:strand:+ start:2646 stop:2837 length:192 start_codon:yes stop_codon:yes gene_type:complete